MMEITPTAPTAATERRQPQHPPPLTEMLGLTQQFPFQQSTQSTNQSGTASMDMKDESEVDDDTFFAGTAAPALEPFSFSGYDFLGTTAASASSLPPNPLANIVHANLQAWMDDEEENGEEGSDEDGSEEEEDQEEDEEMKGEEATTATNASGSRVDMAAVMAAAANANVASTTSASTAAASSLGVVVTPATKRGKKRKPKVTDTGLADDSRELGEILGTGYGGARGSTSTRGALAVMRRGRRAGKFSKLTPDLEKKMGEANSAYINQEFARAVDILLHVIQSAPHAEGPYHTLGLIYEERNDIPRAIEAYLLAAHMSRRDWGLWKRVARMAYDAGEWQHAIYCWTKVLGSEPDNDEIRFERATAYFNVQDYRHALDGYQYLLKKDPHDISSLRQAAACLSHIKRPQSGVTLILGYLVWFKEKVAENEAAAKADETTGHQTKKQKTGATTSSTVDGEGEPVQDYSKLQKSDLDINLVNIMCELFLTLHKYQEVVDTIEDLTPYLKEAIQATLASDELPFDLQSKLGIAYLYLNEYSLAEPIFAPMFDANSNYPISSWGDVYIDVAEAYVNNKMFTEAERLLHAVLAVIDTTEILYQKSKIHFLLARCAHYQALAQIQSEWADPATGSNVGPPQSLLLALNLYEKVHIAEHGANTDARVAMSEIYHLLHEDDKALDILQGVDLQQTPSAAYAELPPLDALAPVPNDLLAGPALPTPSKSRAIGGTSISATSLRHMEDMRVFHQTCELHLSKGRVDDFLAIAIPVLVNLTQASLLVIDDEDEPMPHPMVEPHCEPPMDAISRGLPTFPALPIDKTNSFTAQRSMLTIEFLRPACAAIKQLFAKNRLSESLWLIHHIDRILLRYIHTETPASHQPTSLVSTSIPQPATSSSSGMITPSMSFTEQVRLIMLGLKYVSAGIFLRFGDSERAYHAIRAPFQALPYSFPIAHTMNLILNQQSYPSKAIKTLDRLINKHPDSLPIKLLLGHGCLIHQNYECALQHYLHIYTKLPQQPLILLLIGLTKLQISLKKLNVHRHHDLVAAFSFLFQYLKSKKSARQNQPWASQEGHYNLARAFQYVGLMYMAIPHYQQVLTIATRESNNKTKMDSKLAASSASTTDSLSSLHSDAAHNLACIYAQTGSPDLARRIYAQYCRV